MHIITKSQSENPTYYYSNYMTFCLSQCLLGLGWREKDEYWVSEGFLA